MHVKCIHDSQLKHKWLSSQQYQRKVLHSTRLLFGELRFISKHSATFLNTIKIAMCTCMCIEAIVSCLCNECVFELGWGGGGD